MKLILDAVKSDFPEYKVINITAAGFPIFKKSVICLATLQKGLPVIMDFTLKLLNLGLNINEISNLLSIDLDLIENAYYDLDQNSMYDIRTKRLTDDGRKYISTNKYEQLQRIELPIIEDGFTGHLNRDKYYISNKDAKSSNLNTLEPILDKNNNDNIHGRVLKKILKEYIAETDSDYDGELVEIVAVNNKPTEYKKMYIVVIEDPDGNCKMVVYDKNTKVNYLESKLNIADESGIKLFADKNIDFFLESIKKEPNLEKNQLVEQILNILDSNIFNSDYSHIYFDIPMIDEYDINSEWIRDLERYLKRNFSVKIRFNGPKYPTTYMKNQIFKVIELSKKYKNLELVHTIDYDYAKVLFDKKNCYIDRIENYKLPLVNNSNCIAHKIYKVSELDSTSLFKPDDINNNSLSYAGNTELMSFGNKIKDAAKSLDIEMEECFGVGWLDNGQFLNEHNFNNLKVANNEKKFSDFTKEMNASMVEVVEKIGKDFQLDNYYYNDFKNNYPDLFYSLDRLKVYRNSMQHNNLNSHNLQKYLEYIKEDLNGSFPEFCSNGYRILQSTVLHEIYNAILKTSSQLRKILL